MRKTGLVSITFRNLDIDSIIELVSGAGLDGIEWGGDVHVPHGDLKRAQSVGYKTLSSDLAIAAYGSYYRAHVSEEAGLAFEVVLSTAIALGAPTIRVWAGDKGSAEADEAYRGRVATDLRRIAGLAEHEGLTVSLEYHGNTLTDELESTLSLLRAVDHPNLKCYWQPTNGKSVAHSRENLLGLLPWLTHVHVFHWGKEGPKDKRALCEGADAWFDYFKLLEDEEGYALLEFVRDQSIQQFKEDAGTLKKLLWEANE